MKIVTGNKEVMNSGVISSFGMDDLEFVVDEENSMYLILHVEGNADEDEATIRTDVNEDGKLVFTVINPHVTRNFGPAEPIRIGQLDGKSIYFSFRLGVLGDYKSYHATYTFYKEL